MSIHSPVNGGDPGWTSLRLVQPTRTHYTTRGLSMLCHHLQLNDELVKQAFQLMPVNSLEELVNLALQKLITPQQRPLNLAESTENLKIATDYRIQPVTLGAKLVSLDNIADLSSLD